MYRDAQTREKFAYLVWLSRLQGTGGERGSEAGRQGWSTEASQRPVVLAEELLFRKDLGCWLCDDWKGYPTEGRPQLESLL